MRALSFDQNVSHVTAKLLRESGYAVTTADDAELAAATDERHLLFAAQQQWLLVTHNRKDFQLLHDAWVLWSRAWGITPEHPGILVPTDRWPPERAWREIAAFLAGETILTNTLHAWKASADWQRRPAPMP